jgi:hypothetical protein
MPADENEDFLSDETLCLAAQVGSSLAGRAETERLQAAGWAGPHSAISPTRNRVICDSIPKHEYEEEAVTGG